MHRQCVILVLIECVLLGAVTDASGVAAEDDREAKVKAAYLLNFLRFTMWPPGSFPDAEGELAPIVIVVLGDGRASVAGPLAAMTEDKTVQDRTVTVRRRVYPSAKNAEQQDQELEALFQDLEAAHLLYIDASLKDEIPAILARVGGHLLTVSDSEAFPERGGMLGLVPDGRRIVFEANVDAIERSRVRVSSKVLRLARTVVAEESR